MLGKGLTGGYVALSATVITGRLAAAFWGPSGVEFAAGHTFAGNPVACAVGLATLQEIRDLDVVANSAARGEQALARLRSLQARLPGIGDVRGQGLLFGLEFVSDRRHEGVVPRSRERRRRGAGKPPGRRGLLLRASHWMAVLAPPLTTTAEELDEMLDILDEAVAEVLTPLTATAQAIHP